MDAAAYRRLHAAAVSGHSGCSAAEIAAVTSWPLVALLFVRALPVRLETWPVWLAAVAEFALYAVPQIGLFVGFETTFARVYVPVAVLGLSALAFRLCMAPDGAHVPRRLPNVTYGRFAIMLLSAIAILAVDFRVFPRRFAKTETYGVSVMDVGVGVVVGSLGLTAGLASAGRPRAGLGAVLRSAIPSAVLGAVRTVAVKVLGYQEHESEYGVHWNFFLTLAALPLVVHAATALTDAEAACALLVACYELALRRLSLYDVLLSDVRTSIVMQNKEGLASLAGYAAIALAGSAIGAFYGSARTTGALRRVALRELAPRALVWAAVYAACIHAGMLPSRRLANLPYVAFVLALAHAQYALYALCDAAYGCVPATPLAAAVSANQLAFFLAANVLTGAVNMALPTLLQPDERAVCIITCYTLVLCILAMLLRNASLRF